MTKAQQRQERIQAETTLAEEAREFEAEARLAIEGISSAEAVIFAPYVGTERTRAGAVDRLTQGVRAAAADEGLTDEERGRVRTAQGLLAQAQTRYWSLASSALTVACHWSRKLYRSAGFLSLEDLYQEGVIGLSLAAVRFEPSRGVLFSTYAGMWVRSTVQKAISTSGAPVRRSSGFLYDLSRIVKVQREAVATGSEPTDEEVCQLADVTPERLAEIQLIGRRSSASTESALNLNLSDSMSIGETLTAQAQDTGEILDADRRERIVRDVLASLDARHRDILTRFVLGGESMADIGRDIGLSRERVRQIKRDGEIAFARSYRRLSQIPL